MKNIILHKDAKEKIIKAAQELFARYGFKKTTLDDIAKAAGMTKSALYYYFKNRDDIIKVVASIEINKGKEQLAGVIDSRKAAPDKFAEYVKTRMFVIESLTSSYNFVAEAYFENYSLVEKLRFEVDREEIITIRKIIEEGIEQKIFNPEDPDLTALNIFNILKGMEHAYLVKNESRKMNKEIDNLVILFLQGLVKR